MKNLVLILVFLVVFGVSFYFFLMNSGQSVEVVLWGSTKTPSLPVGLVVLIAFFLGFILGMLFFPLTYVIKRLSS
ncbi:LapA family protein [Hydrogenivirga sp.]